ncbi:MAG TPA: hypothetical protein VG015_09325 [Candidatus Dormibacteraeota bacterium]|jgi:hypothetical protein|nr:hypothetical protein [Candidatus Dormibacteraeota bacterium]
MSTGIAVELVVAGIATGFIFGRKTEAIINGGASLRPFLPNICGLLFGAAAWIELILQFYGPSVTETGDRVLIPIQGMVGVAWSISRGDWKLHPRWRRTRV